MRAHCNIRGKSGNGEFPPFSSKWRPVLSNGALWKQKRAGLSSDPHSDEVYTPSLRRSEGQQGQLGGALFAPCCEQNLYANPKRTANLALP